MSDESVKELRRIAESLDLLVRIALEQIKGERSSKEMIVFLAGLGVAPGKIAELLGKRPENVYPTLSRARKGRVLKRTGRKR